MCVRGYCSTRGGRERPALTFANTLLKQGFWINLKLAGSQQTPVIFLLTTIIIMTGDSKGPRPAFYVVGDVS